ncbi:MAG: branched-chain amino acid transporter permease [Subtercola sp.]|nr:branched-chain amino acid transporter permease [Subtercola sp.]
MSVHDTLAATRARVRGASIPASGVMRLMRLPALTNETVADRDKPGIGGLVPSVSVVLVALVVWLVSASAGLYVQTLVGLFCCYLIAALGYNLVLGFGGQFAFCQSAFMAIGAYTYAVLAPDIGSILAIVAAAVVTPVMGALVGLAIIRTREIYLALITLAFAQATLLAIQLWPPTQGDNGIFVDLGGSFTYVFTIVGAALAMIVVLRLVRSPFGRQLAMIRTDETAAAAMGVNVVLTRVKVFALSAFLGGIAGVLLAGVLTFVTPANFTLELTLMLLTMIVVGGIASVWGTVAGVLLITAVRQLIPGIGDVGAYIDGGLLFVILLLRPAGLRSLIRLRVRQRSPRE